MSKIIVDKNMKGKLKVKNTKQGAEIFNFNSKKFMKEVKMNLRNKFIAHRGLHDSKIIPENSLLAFKML